MTPVIVSVVRSLLTTEWAKKLAGVWLVSFIAASGGILARRFHKESGPAIESSRERLRRRNLWNRRP